MTSLASLYDSLIMDADGVIYRGPEPVKHAVEALRTVGDVMPWSVVTNNAAHPPAFIASKVSGLGLPIGEDRVVTSPQGAVEFLASAGVPTGAEVFVVGGDGIDDALRAGEFVPVRERTTGTRAVVQGFGPDVAWSDLAQASYLIGAGALWVATNLDASIPTDEGFAPGNGALVGAISHALGRSPDAATGKPEPLLFTIAAERMNGTRPLVVGDRIDTDIRGGNAAGMDSLLVLTGVTGPEQVAELAGAEPTDRPTYIARDLRALTRPAAACVIGEAQEAVTRSEDLDGLAPVRSLLAAAWADPPVERDYRRLILECFSTAVGY